MSKRDENFEKKLLVTFRAEADEHIRNMSSWLLELEKNPTDQRYGGLVENIFREAHSLKGAARAVNAKEVESACQLLESVFSTLKNKHIALSAALFDELHRSLDNIGAIILSDKDRVATQQNPHSLDAIQTLEKALKKILFPASVPGAESTKTTVSTTVEAGAEEKSDITPMLRSETGGDESTTELVRVSALELNSLLLQIEELRAPTGALSEHLAGLRDLGALLANSAKEKITVRLELRALREAMERRERFQGVADAEEISEKAIPQFSRLSAVVEQNSSTADLINSKFAELLDLAENNHRALDSKMASLREEARKLSLAPFSLLLQGFPKLVRDLCRQVGKSADLRVSGSEVEADRKLLQEIKDPLLHLLRNCVDHGIEARAERERLGKTAMGTIDLSIAPKDGDKIEITISDDGAGIDTAKIRAALARAGGGSNEQTLSDKDILSFIFQSGVSTSPIITNLSGRGLGLAIARQKVERLGGILTVENRPAIGTTFRIVLPLTLATFRGVLVRSGELFFIVPTASVEHVTRIGREEIKTIENRETVRYGDQTLSLARFRDILELSGTAMDPAEKVPILILWAAGERIAFQVDEILSEQEVLAKTLGPQLARVRNLAGATILSTGKTVPILNVGDLVKSAVKSGGAPVAATSSAETVRKSVLIAEDSITARTLLKNIVESAGYDVKTAVDGLDAYTAFKTGKFDLVVSDVEMPRMTGFDLTAKIRADKEMSETPVVLITALDSREDRERGIDVGANAYIVKSSFDHGDLLQTIERLI